MAETTKNMAETTKYIPRLVKIGHFMINPKKEKHFHPYAENRNF